MSKINSYFLKKVKSLLVYFAHYAFLKQSRNLLKLRKPTENLQLHIGCGFKHFEGFINIDVRCTSSVDYIIDAEKLPCRNDSVKRIETYHVLEHFPHTKVYKVLNEWYRVLSPGGCLVIECPDFDKAVLNYINGEIEMLYSIFGRQRHPSDYHFWGYNIKRLKDTLSSIGFREIYAKDPLDYHRDHEPCLRLEAIK